MPPVSDPMSRVRDRNSSFKKASKGPLLYLYLRLIIQLATLVPLNKPNPTDA